MWGKKNADEMSPLDATAEHETAWLGSSLEVKGEITGTEDLLVDGTVEGRIHLDERKLTGGTAAKATADIDAAAVGVYGHLNGNVPAKRPLPPNTNGPTFRTSPTAHTTFK